MASRMVIVELHEKKNDQRIHKYLGNIIDTLPTKCDDQARELLIILQFMDLGVELEEKAFEICVNIWEKLGKQPSVRYNAFKLMVKIIKKHPELSKELALITESQYMDSLSDTVKRSISKMISKCHYEKT